MVSKARTTAVPVDVKEAKQHAAYAATVDNAQWLSHPLTRRLITALNEQREESMKAASSLATANTDLANLQMRDHLLKVKTLENVIETINSNK